MPTDADSTYGDDDGMRTAFEEVRHVRDLFTEKRGVGGHCSRVPSCVAP
jgi:hypothetical protein